MNLDTQRKGKCAVIKTSTRQTIFLPLIGLVPPESLRPADLIGVNKDSYLVLDKLPAEFDSRVKAMEVDERPTEQYTDIGEWHSSLFLTFGHILTPYSSLQVVWTSKLKS
jgi:26S proteasome regulatory subunit T5